MMYNIHFLGFVIDKEKVIDIISNQYVYKILGYCIYDRTSNKKKYITKSGMKAFIDGKRRFRHNSSLDLREFEISNIVMYNYIKISDFRYDKSAIITWDIESFYSGIERCKLSGICLDLVITEYSCCLFDIKGGLLLEGSESKNYCSLLFAINVDLSLSGLFFYVVYSFTNNRCEVHALGGDFFLLNIEANFDWFSLYDMRGFAECLQNLGFHQIITLDSSDKLTVFEFNEVTIYAVRDADIVISNDVKHAKIFKYMQMPYTDTTIVLGHSLQRLDLYNIHGNLMVVASRGRHYSLLCGIIRDFYCLDPETPVERLLDYYDRGEFPQVTGAELSIEYYSLD